MRPLLAVLPIVAALATPACADDDLPAVREGDALWVIVEADEDGARKSLWAFDISNPGQVLAKQRLLESDGDGPQILGTTPWGAAIVVQDGPTRQLGLDAEGNPAWAPLLPDEALDTLLDARFSADGQRMLATVTDAQTDTQQLWLVDFDQGALVDGELVTEGRQLTFFHFTPAFDAVLWLDSAENDGAPGPLRMAALDPALGPAQDLSGSAVQRYYIFAEKLVIALDDDGFGDRNSLLLPLADLGAAPIPGPPLPRYGPPSFSADGRWLCRDDDDGIHVVGFDGMSFSAPILVDAGLSGWGCSLPLTDTLLYMLGDLSGVYGMAKVDLSGPEPAEPVALVSSNNLVTPKVHGDRLYYISGSGLEDSPGDFTMKVLDLVGGGPSVELVPPSSRGSYRIVDDQRLLYAGDELWSVNLDDDEATTLDSEGPNSLELSFARLTPTDEIVFSLAGKGLVRVPLDGGSASSISRQSSWYFTDIAVLSE